MTTISTTAGPRRCSVSQPTLSRLGRRVASIAVPTALLAAAVVSAPPAQAAGPQQGPQSQTFAFQYGPAATFTVPAATYSVSVASVGGSGASGSGGPGSNGSGGGVGETVTETVPVVPGQTFVVYDGAAATSITGGSGYGNLGGGAGSYGNFASGDGGGGGASTEVGTGSQVVLVAAGGGGGGGGGAVAGYDGGAGGAGGEAGAGGNGAGAGSGGSGNVAGGATYQYGQSATHAGDLTFAGGGGGGGAGWGGGPLGGGVAGSAGAGGGGGGGGGAGGLSYAWQPDSTFGLAGGGGNGSTTFSWNPGALAHETITASPITSVASRPVTFTDTITADEAGVPTATGTVTFQEYNVNTGVSTNLATVPVSNGHATWTTTTLPVGVSEITGIYSGDSSYYAVYTGYTAVTVKPAVYSLTLTPNPVAFGNQTVNTQMSQTVTLTDTGNVPWIPIESSSNNAGVNLSGTSTCFQGAVQPGKTCTFIVLYKPTATGVDNGILTNDSNFPSPAIIDVTGTGIAPVVVSTPTVTGISPRSGPAKGGTRVTVTGQNLTHVTAVTVGSTRATSFTCASPTTCTLVTPAGTGLHNITVTTGAGTSAKVTADQFTYTG